MKKTPEKTPSVYIGWTTFENEETAKHCATELVASGLAFCVQLEGEVKAYYKWEDKQESSREFPVRIKHLDANGPNIKEWLRQNHPYEIPQWISIKACDYLEEYFNWALKNSSNQAEEP